jgi:hypothetical protein
MALPCHGSTTSKALLVRPIPIAFRFVGQLGRRQVVCPTPAARVEHERNDLTSLDYFAEGLTVGIFADELRVENVSRVTR